jgi:hypothetical protein
LKTIGIDRELVKRYRKSGWIEAIGRSAYKLAGDQVTWEGALYALQKQLNVQVHAGGRTALELKGFGHFVSPELRTVYLFAQPGVHLPAWFRQHDWSLRYLFTATNLFTYGLKKSFTEFHFKDFIIRISSPERASMEMLYYVPGEQGFEESFRIMESLTTLRTDIVQQLLEDCNSIKVKRLFLYMAEKQNHFWFDGLDLSRIDLGSGKRKVVENGVLDKKYHITVPRVFGV